MVHYPWASTQIPGSAFEQLATAWLLHWGYYDNIYTMSLLGELSLVYVWNIDRFGQVTLKPNRC